MAAILLGYFTTMVATLVALMMLLNSVLSFGLTDQVHHHPHPVVAQAAAPDNKPDNKQVAAIDKQTGRSGSVIADKASMPPRTMSVAPARLATAKRFLPDRNQRQKLALNQNHKEDAVGRWQDQEHSLALGYAQETQRQPGPLFDLFAPRRF